jgi:hypothetical protein
MVKHDHFLSFPFLPRSLLLLLGLAGVLAALGCIGGDTSGGLYVFDGQSRSVLVWNDLDKLYQAAQAGQPAPDPDRVLRSGQLRGLDLAWGGMALDHNRHRLYLVSQKSGRVYVLNHVNTQKDEWKQKTDIWSFDLGGDSSDRFGSDSVFGQAALDPVADILYVQETTRDGKRSRVWHVGNVSRVRGGAKVGADAATEVDDDGRGAGLAAGPAHKVFALFGEGRDVETLGGDTHQGPRLRQGEPRGRNLLFGDPHLATDRNLLAGAATGLKKPMRYGSLAYDQQHHELYVFAQPPEGDELAQILVFGGGQFFGEVNQAPRRTLKDVPRNLRIICHPFRADWLLGAGFKPGQETGKESDGTGRGQDLLYLWKSPSGGGEPRTLKGLQVKDAKGKDGKDKARDKQRAVEVRGLAWGGG